MKKYSFSMLTLIAVIIIFAGVIVMSLSGDNPHRAHIKHLYLYGLLLTAVFIVIFKYRIEKENQKHASIVSLAESIGRIGSFEWSRDDGMLFLSDVAAEHMGLEKPGKLNLDVFLKKVDPEERESVSAWLLQNCVEKGEKIRIYFETDGKEKLIRFTAVPSFDGSSVDKVRGIIEDVTEHIKAKREREMIFRQSREGIAILDVEGTIKDMNVAFENITGRSRGELGDRNLAELIHSDDREKAEEMLQVLLATGYYDRFELRLMKKSGREIYVQMNLILLPNGSIMLTVRDISAITEYQQKLARSERYLRQLFEVSPIPLSLNSRTGRPFALNKKFLETFGYTLEDLSHKRAWWTLAFPNEQYRIITRERWKKYTQKIIDGEQAVPVQATVTCKDGSKREIIFLYSVFDDMGVVAFSDITERVEAEDRLQEYVSIVDDNVLVVRMDINLVVQSVSKAFCRISEYEEDELLGRTIFELFHEDSLRDVRSGLLENIYAGKVWKGEIKRVTKYGDIFWTQSMLHPVFKNGMKTGFLSVSSDISDKKRIEIISVTDKLTGIFNRMKLDEVLSTEFTRFRRFGHPYSLIVFDIDFFKRVNDTYGHLAGDEVLKALATLIKSSIREADVFGRWGGEEFLIICCGTELDGAFNLASKLRRKVELFEFPEVDKLTCSFGVAQIDESGTENMVKRADDALYRAKQGGRNRVEK